MTLGLDICFFILFISLILSFFTPADYLHQGQPYAQKRMCFHGEVGFSWNWEGYPEVDCWHLPSQWFVIMHIFFRITIQIPSSLCGTHPLLLLTILTKRPSYASFFYSLLSHHRLPYFCSDCPGHGYIWKGQALRCRLSGWLSLFAWSHVKDSFMTFRLFWLILWQQTGWREHVLDHGWSDLCVSLHCRLPPPWTSQGPDQGN